MNRVPSYVVGSRQNERFMRDVEPGEAAFAEMMGIESVLIGKRAWQDVPAMPVLISTHVDAGAAAERD